MSIHTPLRSKHRRALLAALPLFTAAASTHGAQIARTDTTTALNLTGSWVDGVVPGAGDIAVWNNTLTADRANAIGGNLTFAGIKVTDAGGTLHSINTSSGSTLTLGSSGIDMSAATTNFSISAVMDLSASQTWSLASGRTLTLGGPNTGSGTITLSGAGGIFAFGASSNGSSTVTATAGPLGTGRINLEDGIRLTSSVLTTSRVIRNEVNLNGNIEVVMGHITGSGISLSGGLNIGSANRTITLTNTSSTLNTPTLTFGGNGAPTAVTGSGRLVLENGNSNASPMIYARSASGVANDYAVFETDLTIGAGVTFIAGGNNVFTASTDLTINAGGFLNTSNNSGSATTQTIGSLSGAGAAFNGVTTSAVPTLTIDGGARTSRTTFSGSLQNGANSTFNITKQGATTQVFSGANTYTGKTLVSEGTLLINGTHVESVTVTGNGYGSLTAGHFQVATGATLGGSGRIAGNTTANNSNMILVQSGGILAPGDGVGRLTLDGANIGGTSSRVLNMATGAKFDFTLSANGGVSDQIAFWNFVAGDLLLNSNAVTLSLSGNQVGGTYTTSLFKFFSDEGVSSISSGILSGLTIGTLGTGIESASFSYNGGSIDLTYTVATIPEPAATVAQLGLFALGCAALRRRHLRP
jgi:autotransporter-associated beta strand protein